MLDRHVAERAQDELVQTKEPSQRGHVPVEDLEDAGVAAQLAQTVVEREIRARDRRGITACHGCVDVVDQRPESSERCGVTSSGEETGGPALERGAKPIDLADVGGGETDDKGASAGLFLQEPLRSKQFERLAHRTTADRELFRDLGLDEVFARAETPREDLRADPIGGVFGERAGRRQRSQWGLAAHGDIT